MTDLDSILALADHWIVDRSELVVAGVLVLTLVFGAGLGGVSTDAGTSQFIEGVPAQEASEDVSDAFGPSAFEADTGSTQVIQRSQNVLSKPSLVRMLTLEQRLGDRADLRITDTASAASIVATRIDPRARTTAAKRRAIQQATPSEIDQAVRAAAAAPGFESLLSTDFSRTDASASATIGTLSHELPGGLSSMAGTSGTTPLSEIQAGVDAVATETTGSFTVFGTGIVASELSAVIGDSLLIVIPAASLLIVGFMAIAYRDPFDMLLGLLALVITIIWTFGFMGLVGIPFGQMTIAVPVLLLAVGIDFGIHAINRYREERAQGLNASDAMRETTDQLLVAFFIVTGTTVLGFGANLMSDLAPIREFGLVAAIGITFTFVIFGLFLPAAKLLVDDRREQWGLPQFGTTPLGGEDSALGRALTVGNWLAARAPRATLAALLLTGAVLGAYGTGVDTSFSRDDFLPPSDVPDAIEALPEPFAPGEYTVTATTDALEEDFDTAGGSGVTVAIDAPMVRDDALEQIHRASRDPPDSIVSTGHRAHPDSILRVIQSRAKRDPEFAALVARSDRDGNGVPDHDLRAVYTALFDSPAREQASAYLTSDYRQARIVYQTTSDADQSAVASDGRTIADRLRLPATATGQTVVMAAVMDVILQSAIESLAAALLATAIFLIVVYWALQRRPSVGILNVVPILVTVAVLAGTMRALDIPLNALTATVLSIAIGLGIDYSAHLVHRFIEEYEEADDVHAALDTSVRGTGGALAGSMLTTTSGTGVLALAITPVLGQFGLVIALSVAISFLASILVTPPAAVVWAQLVG